MTARRQLTVRVVLLEDSHFVRGQQIRFSDEVTLDVSDATDRWVADVAGLQAQRTAEALLELPTPPREGGR